MNAGNMPPQSGGGRGEKPMTMKSANPEDFKIVYGETKTVAIDIDKDGKADNRASGEAPLWVVDAKHWWSIVVAVRALISAAWHNKMAAIALFFATLGIAPFLWMGGLALLAKDARPITNAEGGGLSGAIGNNLVVNLKNTISVPASGVYNNTIAENVKKSDDIAFSPRDARLERRSN